MTGWGSFIAMMAFFVEADYFHLSSEQFWISFLIFLFYGLSCEYEERDKKTKKRLDN